MREVTHNLIQLAFCKLSCTALNKEQRSPSPVCREWWARRASPPSRPWGWPASAQLQGRPLGPPRRQWPVGVQGLGRWRQRPLRGPSAPQFSWCQSPPGEWGDPGRAGCWPVPAKLHFFNHLKQLKHRHIGSSILCQWRTRTKHACTQTARNALLTWGSKLPACLHLTSGNKRKS